MRENITYLIYGYFDGGFSFQGCLTRDEKKASIHLPSIENYKKVYTSKYGRYIIRNGKRIYFMQYFDGQKIPPMWIKKGYVKGA